MLSLLKHRSDLSRNPTLPASREQLDFTRHVVEMQLSRVQEGSSSNTVRITRDAFPHAHIFIQAVKDPLRSLKSHFDQR